MWVTACNLTVYTEVIQVEHFKFGVRNPLRIEIYREVHTIHRNNYCAFDLKSTYYLIQYTR